MTTPTHMIYSLALFGKGVTKSDDAVKHNWLSLCGAIVPDTGLFIFFLINGLFRHLPHQELWHELYFTSWWNDLFSLLHSLWLIPLALIVVLVLKRSLLITFFGSWFFHNILDFFVHHDDAYRHFYPFSDVVFRSPLSYWDPAYYGEYVSLAAALFVVVSGYVIYKRLTTWRWKLVLVGSVVLMTATTFMGLVL